ncbi:MAG: acylneuraminate cytidylyltransferase family protein [Anaerolineaceae bacterium]|nr:acylneuraminate cytidylyltransferase family protein [Anaerolineaceae bacterium]MBN2677096.1 acylneuraminate cytidylyltransferase family protein [Anaerolineaceae bacterium]
MTDIVALVPMRHQSMRVPEKNYRLIAGRPLYTYILDTLAACSEISQIVVDTDSSVIKDGLRTQYPRVRVIDRPAHLCADTIPMNEVLLYDCELVKADLYLQTHATNPLLSTASLSEAIRSLLTSRQEYDSLFSVTKLLTRLWDASGKALNHDPQYLIRTQDLPPVFEENSCIYIFNGKILAERKNRLGYHPMMFEINANEAWDIDTESDFEVVESLIQNRRARTS